MKKTNHAFITINAGRTYVVLSDGTTAGFPHFPNGEDHTEKAITKARAWARKRSKTQEERDER